MADRHIKLAKNEKREYMDRYKKIIDDLEHGKTYAAKYLGVSVGSINAYLRGDRFMSAKVAVKVGSMVGIEPVLLSPALAKKVKMEKLIADAEMKRREAKKKSKNATSSLNKR